MNERIKELAVAAAPVNSNIPHSEWNIPKEFIEKFAELIVKECLSVVYDPDGTDYGSIHDIVYADIESRIKEHFGVKE